MVRGFWVSENTNLKKTIMSDEKTERAEKQSKSVDYTKNHGMSEKQLKKMSKVKYLNHSSLKKNNKGINPGDIAYVGQMAALQLEKDGKAEILENKWSAPKKKEEAGK